MHRAVDGISDRSESSLPHHKFPSARKKRDKKWPLDGWRENEEEYDIRLTTQKCETKKVYDYINYSDIYRWLLYDDATKNRDW